MESTQQIVPFISAPEPITNLSISEPQSSHAMMTNMFMALTISNIHSQKAESERNAEFIKSVTATLESQQASNDNITQIMNEVLELTNQLKESERLHQERERALEERLDTQTAVINELRMQLIKNECNLAAYKKRFEGHQHTYCAITHSRWSVDRLEKYSCDCPHRQLTSTPLEHQIDSYKLKLINDLLFKRKE